MLFACRLKFPQLNNRHSCHKLTTMSQTRKINLKSVQSIMKGRVAVPQSSVGKRVRLMIQGDGTEIDVTDKDGNLVTSTAPGEEGTVLRKRIFNLRAASGLAMTNPRNKEFLVAGVRAEKAGDTDGADEAFSNYLNATQMSFGVITNSSVAAKLANGVEIAATVRQIDTEKGSLLTIDTQTISVVEPEVLDVLEFNIDDFVKAEDLAPLTPAQIKAAAKAAAAKP